MLHEADQWLVNKVFAPVAHWIDQKLWVNNYRLGAWFMYAGVLLTLSEMILMFVSGKWSVDSTIAGSFLALYWFAFAKLAQWCSKEYEKRPDVLPRRAVAFYNPIKIWWMIYSLLTSPLFLLSVPYVYDHHGLIGAAIMAMNGADSLSWTCGRYFAACPRPPMRRDEKRITDLSFNLVPQGAGA